MATRPIVMKNPIDMSQQELQNVSLEKIAGVPATLFEGREWLDTTANRVTVRKNALTVQLAELSDITGARRYQNTAIPADFSANRATPAAAGITPVIQNGFCWIVSGAPANGVTLTGATPVAIVENGDEVIYTGADNTLASGLPDWSSFSVVDANQVLPSPTASESAVSASTPIPAGVDTVVPIVPTMTTVDAILILDATTGENLTGTVWSSVVGGTITINAGVALAGVIVHAVGRP